MRLTTKKDLTEIADAVLAAVSAIEDSARNELDALDHDDSLRDEVKESRKQSIIDDVAKQYAAIRTNYGNRVQLKADELRALGETLKPSTTSGDILSTLQLLELSPAVSQAMLDQAAKTIGGDPLGVETLRQISSRHGLIFQPGATERHLSKDILNELADRVTDVFDTFFYARQAYDDLQPIDIHQNPDGMALATNRGLRANSEYGLRSIGSLFNFGGDQTLASEYSTAECLTEV